jgi:PRTRC genetic system protein C
MARIFVYDGREFPDPDSRLTVEAVKRQLADFFPELANADTRQEPRGEDTVYTFARRIGTKGASLDGADLAALLATVPRRDLAVFQLAAELLDAGGELDLEAASRRQPEINLAVAEAEANARATRQAREALRRLPAR